MFRNCNFYRSKFHFTTPKKTESNQNIIIRFVNQLTKEKAEFYSGFDSKIEKIHADQKIFEKSMDESLGQKLEIFGSGFGTKLELFKKSIEKSNEKSIERSEKSMEKIFEKTMGESVVQKLELFEISLQKSIERANERSEKAIEKSTEKIIERTLERSLEKSMEKFMERSMENYMKKVQENQDENKKSMDFLRGFMQGSMKIIQESQKENKKEFESKISQVVKLETQMLDFLQNSKINEVHRDLKACKQSIDKDHMALNEKIQKMDENLKKVMEMEQQNIGSTRNVDTSSPEVKVTIRNRVMT